VRLPKARLTLTGGENIFSAPGVRYTILVTALDGLQLLRPIRLDRAGFWYDT
jgi:hypothetical protein